MPEFQWQFEYGHVGETALDGEPVSRPLLPISLTSGDRQSEIYTALVDSGAEHTLAAWVLADDLGIDPEAICHRVQPLAIGGRDHDAYFCDVEITLHSDPASDNEHGEHYTWAADIGFVPTWRAPFQMIVGQNGFFSEFVVSFAHRLQVFSVDTNIEDHPLNQN